MRVALPELAIVVKSSAGLGSDPDGVVAEQSGGDKRPKLILGL